MGMMMVTIMLLCESEFTKRAEEGGRDHVCKLEFSRVPSEIV